GAATRRRHRLAADWNGDGLVTARGSWLTLRDGSASGERAPLVPPALASTSHRRRSHRDSYFAHRLAFNVSARTHRCSCGLAREKGARACRCCARIRCSRMELSEQLLYLADRSRTAASS